MDTSAPTGYRCPMHPEVVANGPGRCPKCGMQLVRRSIGEGDALIPTDRAPARVVPSGEDKRLGF